MTAGPRTTARVWSGAWLTVTFLVICVAAMVIASGFVPATTRYFPFFVSATCVIVASVDLIRRFLAHRRHAMASAGSDAGKSGSPYALGQTNAAADAPAGVLLAYAAWFLGLLAGTWLVGIVAASGVFVAAFLKREAKTRWWTSLTAGIVVVILVAAAGTFLKLRWPHSLFDPLSAIL